MTHRLLPGAITDPNPPTIGEQYHDKQIPVDHAAASSDPIESSLALKAVPSPASAPTDPNPPSSRTLPLNAEPVLVEPVVGQTVVGRYRLIARLGAGGMGIVFKAWDEELRIDVALKILPASVVGDRVSIERFHKEVKLVRDIPHAGVCRVYDFREDGPVPFFTMEFIDGRTLRQAVRDDELEVADVYATLLQVAKALEAVHAKRVVHRDLKPDNVLVRHETGEAVLIDFGLAKQSFNQGATTTGIAGTPKYMSPEQLRGEPFDVRTDVFAFGVMAFELLSGRAPFGIGSDADIVSAILRDPPAPFECAAMPADVSKAMQVFFYGALAKDPLERFVSAAQMREAFEEAWAGRVYKRASSEVPQRKISARVVTSEYRAGKWLSWIAVAMALIVLAAWLRLMPPPIDVLRMGRLDKTFLACDPVKPTVDVHPFKNSSGEAQWDSFASSIADSLRGHLRTSPKLHVSDSLSEFGQCPMSWSIDGTVQKIGDKLRLSVEVRDVTRAALVPPIEVDGEKGETGKVLEKARDILLDDLRRHARLKERDRRAYFGTKNEQARNHLFDYYRLVGTNPQPRKEDLEVGKGLVDAALALDADYVAASVERAYLLSLGVGATTRAEGVENGVRELERALIVQPDHSQALVMRCQLLREAVEVSENPNEAAIESAFAACDKALQKDPTSGQVRLTYARLYNRICDEERSMESLEQVLPLDRSLYRVVLPELINAALHNERLGIADRASRDLIEYEQDRRGGGSTARGVHFLRGAVLLRLAQREPTLYSQAKQEFEYEIARANANIWEKWIEAAAIRGLMHLSKRDGGVVTSALLRRLDDLERDATLAVVRDRYVAIKVAGSYQFTDPSAAYDWLVKVGKPVSFDDYSERIFLLEVAGRFDEARTLLRAATPRENWEQRCYSWLSQRAGN